jgi:nitrogen fixation-related uncharacterized protein
MTPGIWLLVLWSAGILVFLLVWLSWGLDHGQFDDLEETKYTMLQDREPEGWPGRKPRPMVGRNRRARAREEE